MKIIYFGTPQFSAEILRYLIEKKVSILGIITQPDRPKGRDLQVRPSPVKQVALEYLPNVPIFMPEKASDPLFLEKIAQLDADLYVVVAFGQILPQKLLDIPRFGCINVHTSCLPKYRGAAPMHRALMNGEKMTGVSIQKMVKQLDAGDVIATSALVIPEEMTLGELEKELAELAKPLLHSVIHSYAKGIPPATPQDPAAVTYAHKIDPGEGHIDWNLSAREIHNLVRAFSPRPGAWVWVETNGEKKRLKILKTKVSSNLMTHGKIGEVSLQGIVYCLDGGVELLEVQPEGKRPMAASDWLRGCRGPVTFG